MYLSWDIGIKNLAYCMLDYDKDTSKCKIYKWGIINLMEHTPHDIKILKCGSVLKNKNLCTKNAIYIDKFKKGYCKIHSKGNDELSSYTQDIVCSYHNKKKCEKKATFYDTNDKELFYCTTHSKKYLNLGKIVKPKKASKESLHNLGIRLFKILDTYPEFLDAKIILLENQPVYKNPTMKSMQIMLYSYFMIRGLVDNSNSNIEKLLFVSAKNKLKAYTGEPITKFDHITNKYNKTKKLATEYCKILINDDNDNKWIDFFINNKKKDDLADTYLMNIYYIKNHI